jgi:ABC-type transport system substrate-binding protein
MIQGSYDCTKPYPGPTANPKVRQAINYAVDVDAIIKNVLKGRRSDGHAAHGEALRL